MHKIYLGITLLNLVQLIVCKGGLGGGGAGFGAAVAIHTMSEIYRSASYRAMQEAATSTSQHVKSFGRVGPGGLRVGSSTASRAGGFIEIGPGGLRIGSTASRRAGNYDETGPGGLRLNKSKIGSLEGEHGTRSLGERDNIANNYGVARLAVGGATKTYSELGTRSEAANYRNVEGGATKYGQIEESAFTTESYSEMEDYDVAKNYNYNEENAKISNENYGNSARDNSEIENNGYRGTIGGGKLIAGAVSYARLENQEAVAKVAKYIRELGSYGEFIKSHNELGGAGADTISHRARGAVDKGLGETVNHEEAKTYESMENYEKEVGSETKSPSYLRPGSAIDGGQRNVYKGFERFTNGSYSYEGYNKGLFQGISQISRRAYKPKSKRFGFGSALSGTSSGLLIWSLIKDLSITHYNVYNYYNRDKDAPGNIYIAPETIVNCSENTTTLCSPNTSAFCVLDETIFCMANAASITLCKNKITGRCVKATCDDCGLTENVPCIANGKIFGNANLFCVTTVAVPLDAN